MLRRLISTAMYVGAGVALYAWFNGRLQKQQEPPFTYEGKVVIITGGSRGLGLALARQLASEGANLSLFARDPKELERAAEELRERGAEVSIQACDIRDKEAVTKAVAQVAREHGHIDMLVNNAGVMEVGPMDHMTETDYADSLATHFWGPLYMTNAARPHMRPDARVVNITSIGGKIAVPHLAPYSAGKFASVGLSDALRAELVPHGIKVTTVIPGLMRTGSPFNARFRGRHQDEFRWFSILDSLPVISMDARVAARLILEGARRGDAQVVVPAALKVAIALFDLFPNMADQVLKLFGRALPEPASTEGAVSHSGWNSQPADMPSVLTQAGDQAAVSNNQISDDALMAGKADRVLSTAASQKPDEA